MGMDNVIFCGRVMHTPLAEAITEVQFDHAYDYDDEAISEKLTFIVLHILPHLPRLDTITGFNDEDAMRLFTIVRGETDFVSGMKAVRDWKSDSLSKTNDLSLYAWRVFGSIARRIKHWELGLKEEEISALFSIDPSIKQNIRSLSIVSRNNGDFPTLDSNSSPFPALLSSLPSLISLTIFPGCFSRTGDSYDSISQPALSTTYEFASTLTSFTWAGDDRETVVDISLLRFLARFTSLRYLRIRAHTFDTDDLSDREPKTTFPCLTHLELLTPEIDMLDKILDFILLPKLKILDLSFTVHVRDRNVLAGSSRVYLESFYRRISQDKPNLRHVYLSVKGGFYDFTLEHLRTGSFLENHAEPSYKLHVDWQPGLPEMEEAGSDPDLRVTEEQIIEGLVNGIEDMSLWVKHEVDGIKVSKDVEKARELVRAMGPLYELRKWSKV
ncbi:uncharacterized protein JCM6883_006591 [Sporobolomyces salmoneus]|uniref:uncharacterized protein n=1 Tax=Sporobolomyces salmoneus TaxID=183962 RepID=UPI00316C65EC